VSESSAEAVAAATSATAAEAGAGAGRPASPVLAIGVLAAGDELRGPHNAAASLVRQAAAGIAAEVAGACADRRATFQARRRVISLMDAQVMSHSLTCVSLSWSRQCRRARMIHEVGWAAQRGSRRGESFSARPPAESSRPPTRCPRPGSFSDGLFPNRAGEISPHTALQ
jgi:hypothetical protein